MKISPIGPAVPPGLAEILGDLRNAVLELMEATQPHRVLALSQAALPPAEAWPNCVVRVSDLNILAASDGANWIRQDTGAVI